MAVTLQFFAMIMPFGCALMGFATAVAAQTSWYLVVPLLFVGFGMEIFEAVILSVFLDLCNGLVLSVYNGYHGDVDWKFGTAFGLVTAVSAIPPALLLREVIEHETQFVKFTAAFIPAIMAIAFFVKGVRLLKEEKRLKKAQQAAAATALSVESSSHFPLTSVKTPPMKIGFEEKLEDGFVYEDEEGAEGGEENEGDEGGHGDDSYADQGEGAEVKGLVHDAGDHQEEEEEEDYGDGDNGGEDRFILPGKKVTKGKRGKKSKGQAGHLEVEMEDYEMQEEEMAPLPASTKVKGNGFHLLEEVEEGATEMELFQDRAMKQSGAARRVFQSSTNLLSGKPDFRFKTWVHLSYKWVLAFTIVAHIFLGLFMGILYVGGGVFFAFLSGTLWNASLKTAICTGIYSKTIVLICIAFTFATLPAVFTIEFAQHMGLSVPFGVMGALAGAILSGRISKGWLQILIGITSMVVAGAVLTNAFST